MRERYKSLLSMIDLVFIVAAILTGMFVVALLAMRPIAPPTPGPEVKAELLIQMEWPADNFDDIDLWVLIPGHAAIGFRNRETEGVALDRDDLGISNDTYQTDSGTKLIRSNRETVTVRGIKPGRYVVNVQVYSIRPSAGGLVSSPLLPYPVSVRLIKLNPSIRETINRQVTVERIGEQRTAFSFSLNEQGDVVDIDTEDQLPFISIGGIR